MESVRLLDFSETEFFSVNSLNDFINIIKQFPKATDESNRELFERYRAGDTSCRDLLMKTNLRLVVFQAKQYTTTSYELLDIINEAIIGLLKAIDSYDETKNIKFSTYAITCIVNHLNVYIGRNDRQIKRPRKLSAEITAYHQLEQKCEVEGKTLSDEEFCSLLNVTPERLKIIRADYQFNPSSLNQKLSDEDDTEFEDFISYEETGYSALLNSMEDITLMIFLKLKLSPYHYYVLYHRVLAPEKKTQSELAKSLCLARAQIYNIESACLQKLKSTIISNGSISNLVIPRELQKDIESVNTEAIDPDDIVQYLFFRDILTEEERSIFKLFITSMYLPDDQRFSKQLGMDISTYRMFYNSLMDKICLKDSQTEEIYQEFYKNIMQKYGSSIFNIDLDGELVDSITAADYVSKVWDNISFEEAMDIISENNISVTFKMRDLLERYFDGGRERFSSSGLVCKKVEREVNALLFGFHPRNETTITGLYSSLTDNKHRFTLDQYDYLMSRKFGKDNLQKRGIKYVNELGDLRELSRRLEKIHFGIEGYKELNFTKSKYESIRELCYRTSNREKNTLLDMYYGIGTFKHSIQQIADELGVSYEEAKSKVREAKEYAVKVYLGRNNMRIVDKNVYIPYVLDESINLSDRTRTILREYLMENKSYDELAIIHHLTKDKRKISTIISEGLLTINFYRFGIFSVSSNYMTEECREIFASLTLTEEEKTVIQLKFDGKSKEEIMAQTNLTFTRISYILNKFYRACDEVRIASVTIDSSDIQKEVEAHLSERVLNEKERLLLAKLYGISCDVNPTGRMYTEEEFRLVHPEMSKQYKKYLRNALNTVRSKKAGLAKASLAHMPRKDLMRSLKDPRIPISKVERELLYYSFELNGYPYKTLKELEQMYGSAAITLKEKIERTFVTIYKYENGEIPPSLYYEDDVEPFLKYFSRSDQAILKDYYGENLTYSQLEEKHGITRSQIESLTVRLELQLRDFMDGSQKGFDFDYFYLAINLPDIPFYGDKEKAKRIFDLYYEKRMSAREIISYLGLNCKEKVVLDTVSELMIAICKYRMGIRKVKTYTPETIASYYDRNCNEMDIEQQRMYLKYFQGVEEEKNSLKNYSKTSIPSGILLDMITDNHDNVFSFEKTSREEALSLLRNHKELSTTAKNTIYRMYNIHQRDLMSGGEKRKVLRFLSELNVKSKILVKKKVA